MSTVGLTQLESVPGSGWPLGSVVLPDGVQFSLFSRHATQVWLAFFENADDQQPVHEIRLDRDTNRIGDVWTIFVRGAGEGLLYLYRVAGPTAKSNGHRFDSSAFLIDPYAKALAGKADAAQPKCVVVCEPMPSTPSRPRTPMSHTIIYEMHVRGFSVHPTSTVSNPGTYRAVIDRIPYLKELGVTAVELLPVHEPGEYLLPRKNPKVNSPLFNFWGYNTINFYAPNRRYAASADPNGPANEFREMVSALHQAGIEVILDVVYNHSSEKEGTEDPQSFRGIDNRIYYQLDDKGAYRDMTGCGNTLNCNHPIVRDLIVDSLRYWVNVMGVDGFRFDLASVLRRDRNGHLLHPGPLVEAISEDPILRDIKLIAEPWDLAGGYLVGSFAGEEWAEWNAQYRDDVRRFWRGDMGMKGHFALRLTGSPDLFQDDGRTPLHSINFVTAHDGFTLRDLVSYNEKHNHENGEENRDGLSENFGWNCGVEGETTDPQILTLRLRMQKNFLATLFLSLGVPMVLAGDEFGRTQNGNNNAYCQDNEISWVDWSLRDQNAELLRFFKEIVHFRNENPVFSRRTYFTGTPGKPGASPDILWYDAKGERQMWAPEDVSLGCWINGTENGGVALYLIFNPGATVAQMTLPSGQWRVRIDTGKPAPHDVYNAESAPRIQAGRVMLAASRSLVVLSDHHSE